MLSFEDNVLNLWKNCLNVYNFLLEDC